VGVEKVKEILGDVKNIKAAENSEAAKEGEVLILTVPLAAQKETLLSIKEGSAGKAVTGRYRAPGILYRWFSIELYLSPREFCSAEGTEDLTGCEDK